MMTAKKKKDSPTRKTETLRTDKSKEGLNKIGLYRLLEVIGKGGMGTVYLAEQQKPIRRKVALKVLKPGMDTKEIVVRFESEQQALALMNHPNIAQVYGSGITEQGYPYFVMEYVPGIPITEYCDKNKMTTQERLELYIKVCDAIQHAHFKGIVHRDLKPSNVLVTYQDNKHTPKIIDFGIAKALTGQGLTEKTLHTIHGMAIGTPIYMSPEQAELTGYDIDTRTDIYSLGVLLYEILVGVKPFEEKDLENAGLMEILRIIREKEPPKPSTRFGTLGDTSTYIAKKRQITEAGFIKQLKGDLDWIVMKAIEKDKKRRYSSATELKRDIGRYLSKEPISARPPSFAYKISKYIKRNRVKVALLFSVLIVLIISSLSFFLHSLYKNEYLRPKYIQPEAFEGVFYKDAIVQGSFQIWPAKEIRKFKFYMLGKKYSRGSVEGLPDWLIIKEKFRFDNGIGIIFQIDTSKPRSIDGWLILDTVYGSRSCEFNFHVLEDPLIKENVLFIDSPFDMGCTGKEIIDIMRAISRNRIRVSFLHYTPDKTIDFSKFTSIFLHGLGISYVEDRYLSFLQMYLKNVYLKNGGNLIIMANKFMPDSLAQANKILSPFGIRIKDEEYFDDLILDQKYIKKHLITEGVSTLKFRRLSPIEIGSSENTRIIVSNPKNENEGAVVVQEDKGRIIVIGQSMYSSLTSTEIPYDNYKLFENLLKLTRKDN
jgi:serine/threonine protein kinase